VSTVVWISARLPPIYLLVEEQAEMYQAKNKASIKQQSYGQRDRLGIY